MSGVVVVATVAATKIEHVEEVADGRVVAWHIGIVFMRNWIRQVVAATRGQRLEPPIALDELQDRHMVVIRVHHVPPTRERRDHDERDAWAVPKEVERRM